MTVHLEVGMTAISRDGERVEPVEAFNASDRPYQLGGVWYGADGLSNITPTKKDIIAAGYPWGQLGAQVGDTVRKVWCGYHQSAADTVFTLTHAIMPHPDSLYVIVNRAAKAADKMGLEWGEWIKGPAKPEKLASGRKVQLKPVGLELFHRIAKPAPKPADRPRAAHKLDLQDGDVVELVGWQDGSTAHVGELFKVLQNWLWNDPPTRGLGINGSHPKGHRPLFRVISRALRAVDGMGVTVQKPVVWTKLVAGKNITLPVMQMPEAAEKKPDEVIVRYGAAADTTGRFHSLTPYLTIADTHRFTITFPHGSDTGTVTREKL